jgi:hypothetical protein
LGFSYLNQAVYYFKNIWVDVSYENVYLIVKSWSCNREFMKLKSWIREICMLKTWIHEVKNILSSHRFHFWQDNITCVCILQIIIGVISPLPTLIYNKKMFYHNMLNLLSFNTHHRRKLFKICTYGIAKSADSDQTTLVAKVISVAARSRREKE